MKICFFKEVEFKILIFNKHSVSTNMAVRMLRPNRKKLRCNRTWQIGCKRSQVLLTDFVEVEVNLHAFYIAFTQNVDLTLEWVQWLSASWIYALYLKIKKLTLHPFGVRKKKKPWAQSSGKALRLHLEIIFIGIFSIRLELQKTKFNRKRD